MPWKSPMEPGDGRLLRYLLPRPKEKWPTTSCDKFKTPISIHREETLQNGHFKQSNKHGEGKRLGNKIRSGRCISAYSNSPKTPQVHVPKIQLSRPVLPAESRVLWTHVISSSFYKGSSSGCAHLHTLNIRLAAYLDDLMNLNQNKTVLLQDRHICLHLLTSLGFIINLKKSSLIPQQLITYIGAFFNMRDGLIFPTEERVLKVKEVIDNFSLRPVTARYFLHLLGLMASCIELVPNARLHMRPIQLHLLSFWKPSKDSLEMEVPCTRHLLGHLKWWCLPAIILKGRSLGQVQTTVTITTDASKSMYGGHMGNSYMQGVWSEEEKKLHINILELEVVFLEVKHFPPAIKGKIVLLKTDNTTVVQYINKQGGTHSSQLCLRTWNLWNFALQNSDQFESNSHLQEIECASRSTEWSLNFSVVQSIFQTWGCPLMDLFASDWNHRTPLYCSWFPSLQAFAIDALSIPWANMFAYAFPPICLIPKVLSHMLQFHCQIILIARQWPRRHWYPSLLQLFVACPIRLHLIPDLLTQPRSQIVHPNPGLFKLTAWMLSTDKCKRRDFLKTLENFSEQHGEKA